MKRLRPESSMSSSNSAAPDRKARIAAAIRYREMMLRRAHPASEFGRAYMRRGTPEGIAEFGETWKKANAEQRLNRQLSGWTGRGKYASFGKSLRAMSGYAKTLGKVARTVGKTAVEGAKNYAAARSALTGGGLYGGQGKYDQVYNQLMDASDDKGAIVTGSNDETDSITITDREFVKKVYAPAITQATAPAINYSSFAQETLNVNPGLQSFAPNLSQIALNFGEVEFHQLVFELRPVVEPSVAGNGNVGSAMMVFNYNPNEDPYDNSDDILQSHGSVSSKITDGLTCGVECDPSKTNKTKFFIRNGPVPYQKDADEYDIGVLTIATEGIPQQYSNSSIFELHVYYKVTLRKRKAGAIKLMNEQMDMFIATGSIASSSLFSGQFITGNGGVLASYYNSIGGRLTAPAVRTLLYTFPASYQGLVRVRLWLEGASSAFTGVTRDLFGNISAVNDMYGPNLAGDVRSPESFVEMYSTDGAYYETTLRVRNSTAGVDNSVRLLIASSTASTVQSWTLTVYEHTANHWTSRTNPQGVFVNVTDGIVYAPNTA